MKTWKAERESALPIDDTWYQGSTIEKTSAAAAPPAMRDSGGSPRSVPPRLTARRPPARASPHRVHQDGRVGLADRAQLALERELPVLGRPLADPLEVVLDRLGAQPLLLLEHELGLASKRHGYGSALPGLPGHTFARSSNIGPVSRIAAANAITRVR